MPLLFMLCLAAFGLSFYPALIAVIIILFNRWRHDKYDFIFMLTIFFGEYGFTSKTQTIIFMSDIALVLSALLWIFYRRPPLLSKMLVLFCVYIGGLVFIATRSIESMSIQLLTMRIYFAILYIIVPVAVFSGIKFDISVFFRKALIFTIIISAFYIADSLIISGNFFVPNTFIYGNVISRFYDLYWQPLSFSPFRKYPPGLYLAMLAIYPAAKYYTLRWWQWLIICGGLLVTFTFSVIIAYVVVYLFLVVKPAKILKYSAIVALACVSVYFIDGMLPVAKEDTFDNVSRLRIKSSVDQILELRKAVDDEDIARFASGRMAQAIPKFELVAHEGRQAFGLGFLHRDKTKINRYIITNEYYTDISQNIEVATGIEIVPAQIYVTIGYVGLALHVIVFVLLYLMVRKLRGSVYVLSVLCANVITGLGGFAGLITPTGLYLVSLSIAAALLSNRKEVWGRAWRE